MFVLYIPNAILISAAVIPAIALLMLVYREDRVEREPPALLMRLVLYGIIATSIAKLLERLGVLALNSIFPEETLLYDVLLYFGVVALAEEGAKYALLKRITWRNPAFNCRFDGVVYATFLSLGFALWENIGYVLTYGLGTAFVRAATAIPGHACFGVYMGCWYAQAAMLDRRNDESASKAMRIMAVIVPALLHGAYDFLATSALPSWTFLAFVAALFMLTFRLARKLSNSDRYF